MRPLNAPPKRSPVGHRSKKMPGVLTLPHVTDNLQRNVTHPFAWVQNGPWEKRGYTVKRDPWIACKPLTPPPCIPNFCPILPHFSLFLSIFPIFPQFSFTRRLVYPPPSCPPSNKNHRFLPVLGWFITIFPFSFPKTKQLHPLSTIFPYVLYFGIVFPQGSASGNFWAFTYETEFS